MAMSKNKTGIMAAITAAADAGKDGPAERAQPTLPKGTIGSVRAGLGGIQEIATDKILSWGPKDRLELTVVNSDDEGVPDLAESIRETGQQVPVLLRPSAERDGFFEVIYGRRRILACGQLGIPVKALIRTLDDTEALMAKGLENSSRADLSFYERARFAQAILEQGYSRAEVLLALSISKATLSQLERVARLIPESVGDMIGAAPGAGRPKWMALATAFDGPSMNEGHGLKVLGRMPAEATSDERLEALLADVVKRGAREKAATDRVPMPGVTIKSAKAGVSLSVKRAGESAGFADWLDSNLDGLIETAFARFKEENRKG